MATGGCEAVYRHTTNPLVATGDGIAMVYRAKGAVKDMEFIQFHPTALYPSGRPPLVSSSPKPCAVMAACCVPMDGKEFMQKYDPRLSLAPRDIVARAIDNEMKQRGEDHVYLDVTHKDPEETKKHFPNIYKKCLGIGIDITQGIHTGSPRRPLSLRWHQGGFGRTEQHPPPVRHRRMFVHRTAWRQPSGNQLTDRSRGLCRRGSQTRAERTGTL